MMPPFPVGEFLAGRLPAREFGHRQHVQAAHALLLDCDFAEAARLYSRAIRTMAVAAGDPGKFNMTITVAMLSAIAERMRTANRDFDSFASHHAELFDPEFLLGHYSKERLQCDLARTTFILPDRPAN
jgi:hypothetical protein